MNKFEVEEGRSKREIKNDEHPHGTRLSDATERGYLRTNATEEEQHDDVV